MGKVCEHLFKVGYQNLRKDGFNLHHMLKQQLDYYLMNVIHDWDFTIIICGEGEVRVGKSYLASQIAQYWTSEIKRRYGKTVPFNIKQNYVFDGNKLIEKGNALGAKYKYSALVFDEAGADLEGAKAMMATTRACKDYLRECGQYNNLTILVLPEFFDLPKGIALSRSDCMINVYYIPDEQGYFQRGYFKFYNRPNKKMLYLKGKKELNYNAWKQNFYGDFPNFLPFSKEEYELAKRNALKKRESNTVDKKMLQRNICWDILHNEFGMTMTEIARRSTAMGAYTIHTTIVEALKGLQLQKNIIEKSDNIDENPDVNTKT